MGPSTGRRPPLNAQSHSHSDGDDNNGGNRLMEMPNKIRAARLNNKPNRYRANTMILTSHLQSDSGLHSFILFGADWLVEWSGEAKI